MSFEPLSPTAFLTRSAGVFANRTAVIDGDTRYTYAELNQRANCAANFLQEKYGVHKGDRVSILAHNNIAYVDLLFGIGKIGAISDLPEKSLEEMFPSSGANAWMRKPLTRDKMVDMINRYVA